MQAKYDESVYNENNKRKGKTDMYGNGVDWTSTFMRTDNTESKTNTAAYVKIMKDCGILDMCW